MHYSNNCFLLVVNLLSSLNMHTILSALWGLFRHAVYHMKLMNNGKISYKSEHFQTRPTQPVTGHPIVGCPVSTLGDYPGADWATSVLTSNNYCGRHDIFRYVNYSCHHLTAGKSGDLAVISAPHHPQYSWYTQYTTANLVGAPELFRELFTALLDLSMLRSNNDKWNINRFLTRLVVILWKLSGRSVGS